MNATARASLIALAAIAAACWAVPALLVGAVPPDAGMFAMMALLYALLPITAVALGLLAAAPCEHSFGCPRRSGPPSPSCFPSRSRAARTSRSTASPMLQSATPPWSCAPAWPSGVAHRIEPDVHKGPYRSVAFGAPCESSVHLLNLRCAYQIFGAPVNHFPFGLSCSGAPKFSKCTEDEMRCALGAQRFKELGAYRANQRGPHIARTSLQSHHDS